MANERQPVGLSPLDAEVDNCDSEDADPDECKLQPAADGMKENQRHRRHAIQIAGQLPDGKEDALLILQVMTRLVSLPGFWNGEPEEKPVLTVVRIGG